MFPILLEINILIHRKLRVSADRERLSAATQQRSTSVRPGYNLSDATRAPLFLLTGKGCIVSSEDIFCKEKVHP
jgi:hypothetical protein